MKINQTSAIHRRVPYLIAEMACSHDGSIDKAKKLIQAAVEANMDAIQLEMFEPDDNLVPGSSLFDLMKTIYFSAEEWSGLIEYGHSLGIDVFVFAYDSVSLQRALDIGVDGVKLNSSDLLNYEMLEVSAKSGLVTTLGTGGSTLDEIVDAFEYFTQCGGVNPVLMHGIQTFPTALEHVRLSRIEHLKSLFPSVPIGYADHTAGGTLLSKQIDLVALGIGVDVLEKHLTLDRSEKGIDYQSALEPAEMSEWVTMLRDACEAMGTGKAFQLNDADYRYRRFQKKIVVAGKDLNAGVPVNRDDVLFLRDEGSSGVSPMHFRELFGGILKRNVRKFEAIQAYDVGSQTQDL